MRVSIASRLILGIAFAAFATAAEPPIAADAPTTAPSTRLTDRMELEAPASPADAIAMNKMGALYETGKGVPQDYKLAMVWYRKAADGGYAVAMNNIGALYDHGKGVTQDY